MSKELIRKVAEEVVVEAVEELLVSYDEVLEHFGIRFHAGSGWTMTATVRRDDFYDHAKVVIVGQLQVRMDSAQGLSTTIVSRTIMERWHDVTDACPGCGNEPGDGLNPECQHPDGCGYWRRFGLG